MKEDEGGVMIDGKENFALVGFVANSVCAFIR